MRVVVLGADVSGHTAVAFLKKKLGKKHEVVVVAPCQLFNFFRLNLKIMLIVVKGHS